MRTCCNTESAVVALLHFDGPGHVASIGVGASISGMPLVLHLPWSKHNACRVWSTCKLSMGVDMQPCVHTAVHLHMLKQTRIYQLNCMQVMDGKSKWALISDAVILIALHKSMVRNSLSAFFL